MVEFTNKLREEAYPQWRYAVRSVALARIACVIRLCASQRANRTLPLFRA
jgi:hypothetical protein